MEVQSDSYFGGEWEGLGVRRRKESFLFMSQGCKKTSESAEVQASRSYSINIYICMYEHEIISYFICKRSLSLSYSDPPERSSEKVPCLSQFAASEVDSGRRRLTPTVRWFDWRTEASHAGPKLPVLTDCVCICFVFIHMIAKEKEFQPRRSRRRWRPLIIQEQFELLLCRRRARSSFIEAPLK